jgi:hypothetical protein
MRKRIAVLTDATSADFWFPKWYEYYSNQFGADALHVVTYSGRRKVFRTFDVAALWDVPHSYDDKLRAVLISSLVRTLLLTHDIVIRCDVDEFLIANPRQYTSLSDYIQRCELKYVTAYGIDIFEKEGDSLINVSMPVLVSQRRHGIVNSPLHKIAVTTIPLDWAAGFHAATAPPAFDSLYLFHMKFADVGRRSEWFQFMKASVKEGGPEHKYFSFTQDQMKKHKVELSNKPCLSDGWSYLSNMEEKDEFLASVTRWPTGTYQGTFAVAKSSFVIPEEFRDKF